jgi:transposase
VCGSRARAGRAGGREEVRTYQTMTRWLLVLADRLGELGVTRVVMEATSDDWRGVFYLLEAHGFQTWLTGARDVKHLPGRPKTDTLDAVWLGKVAERQMLRPSFAPPTTDPAAAGRDRLPGGSGGGADRGEAAGRAGCWRTPRSNSRWSPATSSGSCGRAMLAALVAGERDPKVLAQLARARMRAKLSLLEEAFTGCFTDQHAFLLSKLLGRVDALDADLAELDAKLQELIAPSTHAVDRLDEIPGVGQTAAHLLIAEIGADTGQVPDRRAPGVVGQVRPGRQGVRRQTQGPRIDRARQPLPGSRARRGRRRGREDR